MRRMRHLKPREIQGCQLALDASIPTSLYDATSGGSLVAADGAVARWEDQSGNARHATQVTSGSRPLRRVAGLNGADTLQFDGTDDALLHGATAGSDPNTIFAVARATAAQTGYRRLVSYGTSSNSSGAMLLLRTTSSAGIGTYTTTDVNSGFLPGTTAFAASLKDFGDGSRSFQINAKAFAPSSGGNPVSQTSAHIGGISGQFSAMHLAVAAIWNIAVADSVINRMQGAAMRKWRING